MRPGKSFEALVFDCVQRAVAEGRLGLDPKMTKVRFAPKYFSSAREADIEFDVSIEVHALGKDDPFLIWIWECKDVNRPLPIDEVEEFHAKLQQIGADRTKGTLISRGSFQRSALNYARSQGIGIARLIPPAQIESVYSMRTLLPSTEDDLREVTRALTEPDYTALIEGYRESDYESEVGVLFGVTESGVPSAGSDIFWYMRDELMEIGGKELPP